MNDAEFKAFLDAIPEAPVYALTDELVAAVKKEGATDDDIRWWWGMSQEGRKNIMNADNATRLGAFLYFNKDLHLSSMDALKRVHATHIVYSEYPLDAAYIEESRRNGFTPDDYVLPWELGQRIGKYVNALANSRIDKGLFQIELKRFTSVNAYIRHKIAGGYI